MTIGAMLALAMLGGAQDADGRRLVGVYAGWGAIADAAPRRCYAIAQAGGGGGGAAFASVSTWPAAGARNQLHIRLSRARAATARVTLAIGERRFALVGGAADAWAPDAATDRAIVAALRGGRAMSVESVAAGGAPFADVYALQGAATAIDAAAVACARP